MPFFDTFTAKNQGEDRRYTLILAVLMEALMQSPRVMAVFAGWAQKTELDRLAEEVAHISDRVAKALKLPDRATLNQRANTIDRSTLPQKTRRLLAQREAACARFTEGQCASIILIRWGEKLGIFDLPTENYTIG
jgi:hypothetical protein